MWTGKYENAEYSAQIAPYHGRVHAEIIKRKKETGGFEGRLGSNLWLTVMDKSFGKAFRKEPREKDWLAAKAWVEEQLELITEHATGLVTTPKFLLEIEKESR